MFSHSSDHTSNRTLEYQSGQQNNCYKSTEILRVKKTPQIYIVLKTEMIFLRILQIC